MARGRGKLTPQDKEDMKILTQFYLIEIVNKLSYLERQEYRLAH